MPPVDSHTITLFDKSILYTAKSVFRVEESRNAKATYEGQFASSDPVKAIRYYQSTTKDAGSGWRVRLVKDGDEFIIITKKTF
jgi:hypothetical protein